MAHVSVIIDGKTYRMACNDGQEDHLRALAEKMDSTIQQLKEGFGEVGDQRLAVMAGIVMADELSETERLVRGLRAEIDSLRESRTALVDRYQSTEETLTNAILELAHRVDRLTTKLDGTVETVAKSDVRKLAAE